MVLHVLKCKSSRITISNSADKPITHTQFSMKTGLIISQHFFFPVAFPYSLTLSPSLSSQTFYFSFMESIPHTQPHPNCWMNSSFIAKMQPIWHKLHHPLHSITQQICLLSLLCRKLPSCSLKLL